MRIITLHQPWASLVALGLKQYETRSWATKYRGKLAIHAGKKVCTLDDLFAQGLISRSLNVSTEEQTQVESALELYLKKGFLYGQILTVVDLVNCWRMIDYIDRIETIPESVLIDTVTPLEQTVGNWKHGRFAWRLENNQPLSEPIPFKGGQGLRNLDTETEQKILTMIGDAK